MGDVHYMGRCLWEMFTAKCYSFDFSYITLTYLLPGGNAFFNYLKTCISLNCLMSLKLFKGVTGSATTARLKRYGLASPMKVLLPLINDQLVILVCIGSPYCSG